MSQMPATVVMPDDIQRRYLELRRYVGWQEDDPQRLREASSYVLPHIAALIDDFYEEIQRHPEAVAVITGGDEQIARLKSTLQRWIEDLFTAEHGHDFVVRRWQVGWRHVEIGLRQVYVNAAMSRLRSGILRLLRASWRGTNTKLVEQEDAISRALDLDLATIQDAYDAEKVLRSETAFRNLVEAAACAIIIIRENQQIVYFNPHAETITGFTERDVLGRNFAETLLPVDDREPATQIFARVFRGETVQGFERAVICHDGTERRLLWNARCLKDFAGGPALLAVGYDVTELKLAQQRALQAERLAAIGQTVAGIAHESRNAFQRIQACLEMLALEVEDRPEAMNLVERIQRAQEHLQMLYEEVRSYAAPITLERQTADLSQAWREAWAQLEPARRGRSVSFRETSDGDANCDFDAFAMTQVFRNVLENSLAACDPGGNIELRAEHTTLDGAPALSVSIADDGPGIAAAACPRAFDPFFTTKAKGTGLGLAIAKRIVDAHQGTISIKNRPERGAEVQIVVPVAPSQRFK